jgi:hypothetical protein
MRKMFLGAAVALLSGAAAAAEPQTTTETMSFEACLRSIQATAAELGITPRKRVLLPTSATYVGALYYLSPVARAIAPASYLLPNSDRHAKNPGNQPLAL